MGTRADAAVAKFSEGYNCAQSVLWAFCEDLGLDADTALRVACGFGGGMGRRQEVCGAVSGAIMAIGLKHGRGEGEDRAVTDAAYAKVRELMALFEARLGSYVCRDLLDGCDLRTEEGQRSFRERGLLNRTCKPCVATAAEALEAIL